MDRDRPKRNRIKRIGLGEELSANHGQGVSEMVEIDRWGEVREEDAVLVIIDVQEGLVRAMEDSIGKMVVRNVQNLLGVAQELAMPVLSTEQYPKGLGPTVHEVRELLREPPIEKVAFDASTLEPFTARLTPLKRRQLILTGIEAHICVLQTCAGLLRRGYEVYVVADGASSRRKLDWEMGLRWMGKKGAIISTAEMIAFQLMKEAGTERFKRLVKGFK